MSSSISFILDNQLTTIDFEREKKYAPTTTVLQFLRSLANHKGTKEGCAEGDCGACTIVLASPGDDGRMRYHSLDSCLMFLPMLHGKQVITVENLSAQGYFRTPGISWDKKIGQGKPFNYYAFGMAVSEVSVDILTGYHKILRTDIIHDAGNPINPGIDLGQVYGGFIQGLGWCTTEDCKWDEKGNLLNHSPDTYKIPALTDIPVDFRVSLLKDSPNPRAVRLSKAVGEPPLMLSLSVWLAIKDALSAVKNHTIEPDLPLPATNEAIIKAVEKMLIHG